MTEQCLTR